MPAPQAAVPQAGDAAALRAALQGAGTFVWDWDIDSDALDHLDQDLGLLGCPRASLPRTRLAWNRLIHPDDLAASHAAYLRHAGGQAGTHEHLYRVRAHDGGWHWCRERGRIVERHADGRPRRMVGTLTDVTEQHARDEAEAAAAVRLERVAQHVPGVLYQFELDAAGRPRFDYVSERSLPVFGLNPGALRADAAALLDRIDAADRRRLAATIADSASRLALWRCEFRLRRPDGVPRWVLAVASPQRSADGPTVWHGYAQDVSELRELQRARQGKAAAEAANAAKTEFLSRMSHELRTPLNAILGFAQIMVEELLGPIGNAKYADYSKDIVASGRHLLSLINDILDMAKVEAGKMALEEEWFDLDDSVDAALLLVRERATANELVLEKSLPSPPTVVWADLRRLRQVWINLLSNAVKFTQRGGRVRLEAVAEKDGSLTVTVSDTGIGIAPENLERVLQPFAQVANALSRGHEGTGLGLTLSKKMVELHGGGLMLESRLGTGTTVSVWLPADRCRHAGPPLPATQPPALVSVDMQHDFSDGLARGEQPQPGSSPVKRKARPEKRAPLAAD